MSTWSSYSSFWGLPDIFFLLFSASLTTSTILLKVGFLTPVFLLNWASLSLFICVYMPLFYRGTGTFERGLISSETNLHEISNFVQKIGTNRRLAAQTPTWDWVPEFAFAQGQLARFAAAEPVTPSSAPPGFERSPFLCAV